MPTGRIRRVNEAVREVLSVYVTERLEDPRIGFMTLTSVETSPDLRHARVYFSVLGTPEERELAFEGLRSSRARLQSQIGRQLRMKRTPTLEFFYDESIDRGMRINELLEQEEPGGGAGS